VEYCGSVRATFKPGRVRPSTFYALRVAFLYRQDGSYEADRDIVRQGIGIAGVIKVRVVGNEDVALYTGFDVGQKVLTAPDGVDGFNTCLGLEFRTQLLGWRNKRTAAQNNQLPGFLRCLFPAAADCRHENE